MLPAHRRRVHAAAVHSGALDAACCPTNWQLVVHYCTRCVIASPRLASIPGPPNAFVQRLLFARSAPVLFSLAAAFLIGHLLSFASFLLEVTSSHSVDRTRIRLRLDSIRASACRPRALSSRLHMYSTLLYSAVL